MGNHLEGPECLSTVKLSPSGEAGVTAGVVSGPRAPTVGAVLRRHFMIRCCATSSKTQHISRSGIRQDCLRCNLLEHNNTHLLNAHTHLSR